MASPEKREFDKYLKFFTFKATQVIVQSRKGQRISTKSNPQGNDWFNLSIPDDKQVSCELRRSLDGRLPQPGQPVCVEILMETAEGDSVVLEIWSIDLDHSHRDVSVSVAHVLYPRLSLMLRSLVVISRTTPAYRLSRKQDEDIKFTFRVYSAPPDISTQEFKSITCSRTACPYGTISLSVLFRECITLPERPTVVPQTEEELLPPPNSLHFDSLPPGSLPQMPFAPYPTQPPTVPPSLSITPFGAILSHGDSFQREESHDTLSSTDDGRLPSDQELLSLGLGLGLECEHEGYIMVDLPDIKPTFSTHPHVDELGELLQKCRDVPSLDMLSGENSMDLEAAMKLIDEKTDDSSRQFIGPTVNIA